MNTYYYADFPALLALLSHLPDDIFQHEFIDERLRWRNGELTKFCPVCPIPKANKGSFAAQTGCRERGARRVAQGLSRMVAPVARDALVRLRAHLWGSRTVCARVSYACPMPVYVDVPAGLIWLHLVLITMLECYIIVLSLLHTSPSRQRSRDRLMGRARIAKFRTAALNPRSGPDPGDRVPW